MAETDTQQIESVADAKEAGTTDVELWLKKIAAARDDEDDWHEEAEIAVKVYEAHKDQHTTFNLFHSNIETLVPSLYNSTPIPDVRRRFGDKDPVAKMGADIIERAVSYSCDQYPFDNTMLTTVMAAVVPGRGQARVRYKPQPMDPAMGGQGVGYQELMAEPVAWDKWGRGPGLFWEEVPFVWFDHDMNKEDLAALVGEDVEALERIKGYGTSDKKDDDTKKRGILKTVKVHEIWDKATKSTIWITPQDKEFPLKIQEDVLKLPDFFPCPPPLMVSNRVGSLVPMCPYTIYKPLLDELDKVTKRITKLIGQLKVRGLVAADMIADLESLSSADDGQYVAAQNASQFATGGGGLDKAIHHMPLAEIVAALQQLYVQRDQIKQTIYEVTGISDILRGASDPNETLGAQQIKQEWGSLRLKKMQNEVARFARDLIRIKSAIISGLFTPQNISLMTSLPAPDQDQMKAQQEQQLFMGAIQLLKQDTRSYRIDIETDSTIRADMAKAQEQMTAFLTATTGFATGIAGLVQTIPQIIPPAIEVYSQFARRFKLGKQAEDALESLSGLAQEAQQQMEQGGQLGPPPSPEQEADKAKAAGEQERHKMTMEADQAKQQSEQKRMAMEDERDNAKHQREVEKFQMEQAAVAEQRQHEKEGREHDKMMRAAEFESSKGKYEDEKNSRQMKMQGDSEAMLEKIAGALVKLIAANNQLVKRVDGLAKIVEQNDNEELEESA